MASAGLQFFSALETLKYAKKTGETWTLADSFLLDMGGIAVHFPDQIMRTSAEPDARFRNTSNNDHTTAETSDHGLETSERPDAGLLTGLSTEDTPFESDWRKVLECQDMENESMGPTKLYFSVFNQSIVRLVAQKITREAGYLPHKWWHTAFIFQYDTWILNGSQSCYAKDVGIIGKIPRLSMGALANQNRGSILVKALAVLQVLWLVTQILVRAHEDLPSTQLEILTLAYAVVAFFIYLLLWEKPQDVMTMTRVDVCRPVTIENMEALIIRAPADFGFTQKAPWTSTTAVHPIGNSIGNLELYAYTIAAAGSLVFGAVHLAAWNFAFPTTAERWLWRISSLITANLPLLFIPAVYIMFYLAEKVLGSHEELPRFIARTSLGISSVIYVAARLFIMVEAFRTFGFLPVEAFQSTWAANVPHVG